MALTLLTRRDPFADFDTLIRRAFPTQTRTKDAASALEPAFQPAADIVRDGEDALIRLDAPGLDLDKDIDVELTGSTLTISGKRRDAYGNKSEDGTTVRVLREVRYGTFRRSFSLPEQVTADQLSADYEAGVLTVRVEGAYADSQPQKINITVGLTPARQELASDRVVDADTAQAPSEA